MSYENPSGGEVRALALREACADFVDLSGDVLSGDTNPGTAVGHFMDLNTRLTDLGIDANMHKVDSDDPEARNKRDDLMESPSKMMEFVGGWVRAKIEETVAFSDGSRAKRILIRMQAASYLATIFGPEELTA